MTSESSCIYQLFVVTIKPPDLGGWTLRRLLRGVAPKLMAAIEAGETLSSWSNDPSKIKKIMMRLNAIDAVANSRSISRLETRERSTMQGPNIVGAS